MIQENKTEQTPETATGNGDLANVSGSFTVCLMDMKLKKIGCVLLQAVYGGDRYLPMKIGTEHWFLAPTPDMQLFKIPNEEIPKIIEAFRVRGQK